MQVSRSRILHVTQLTHAQRSLHRIIISNRWPYHALPIGYLERTTTFYPDLRRVYICNKIVSKKEGELPTRMAQTTRQASFGPVFV